MSSDLVELLHLREEQFRQSPERHQYSLSADQWRSAINAAMTQVPQAVCIPLQSDRELGTGMDLGDGVLIQPNDDEGIRTIAEEIASQANALLPSPVWSSGRVENHFWYYVDPETDDRYVVLEGLAGTLADQAYPPLVGIGG